STWPQIVFERLADERDRAHEILIGHVFATRNAVFLERVSRMNTVQGLAARERMKKTDQLSLGVRVPAVEPDAEFEGRISPAHEFRLGNPEVLHGAFDGRHRRFTDADDADLWRLDD